MPRATRTIKRAPRATAKRETTQQVGFTVPTSVMRRVRTYAKARGITQRQVWCEAILHRIG